MKLAVTTFIFCVASLLALGIVMLYSASMADPGTHYLRNQIVWGSLGLVACVIAASLDYRMLKKYVWPMLAFAVLLLMVVLVPIHHFTDKINGARRWISLGPTMRFQPSELAKLTLIIAVAWYGERYQRHLGDWKRGLVYPALFIGMALGLIFVEPDRGTTILLSVVTGLTLFVAGARWKFIIPPVVAGATGLAFSLLYDPMRTKRIFAWLHADEHKRDVGYQANQGLLGFGSGGWFGLGLGNSREKLGFLPEHNTDFIFPIVGEELGLLATLLVVLAFVLIIFCGMYIASKAQDTFGFLLAVGITFLIGLQAFINIGVVTSVLPNKGLPLPFISYGGSSMLIMLTSVGLLLSVARRARAVETNSDNSFGTEGVPQLS